MVSIEPMRPGDDRRVRDLQALFDEAYNPPPWGESSAENASTIAAMVRDAAGWRGFLALDGDRVLGVAQGSFGSVLLGDLQRLAPGVAASLSEPLFEFHQLVVSTSARGRGLGSRLHHRLLDGVVCDAILATHPDAEDARRLYRSRGWQEHGTLEVVPGFDRTIMTRSAVAQARAGVVSDTPVSDTAASDTAADPDHSPEA